MSRAADRDGAADREGERELRHRGWGLLAHTLRQRMGLLGLAVLSVGHLDRGASHHPIARGGRHRPGDHPERQRRHPAVHGADPGGRRRAGARIRAAPAHRVPARIPGRDRSPRPAVRAPAAAALRVPRRSADRSADLARQHRPAPDQPDAHAGAAHVVESVHPHRRRDHHGAREPTARAARARHAADPHRARGALLAQDGPADLRAPARAG